MNTQHIPVTSDEFFVAWKSVCLRRLPESRSSWEKPADFTALIYGDWPHSIVAQVAEEMLSPVRLNSYSEYYALDAVFFAEEDLVPGRIRPKGSTWIRNIRVAFEHENFFTSGLFKEVSHLLITRAELRVLVTYPEEYEIQTELDGLAEIINGASLSEPAFLFVTGRRINNRTAVQWLAYTFRAGKLSLSD